MPVSTEPQSRQRLSRGERRNQLLDVTAGMLLSHGFDSLTMEGLAGAAGVSRGLPYSYFSHIDEVVAALLEREVADLYHRIEAAIDARQDFEDKIRAGIAAYFDVVAERGPLIAMLRQGIEAQGPDSIYTGEVGQFLTWLSDLVQREYAVTQPEAVMWAITIAGVADLAGRALAAGAPRDHIEVRIVEFILGGLARAVRR